MLSLYILANTSCDARERAGSARHTASSAGVCLALGSLTHAAVLMTVLEYYVTCLSCMQRSRLQRLHLLLLQRLRCQYLYCCTSKQVLYQQSK